MVSNSGKGKSDGKHKVLTSTWGEDEEKDPDYFRLIGDLDIVTVNADTGKEAVQTVRVTFKSIGKSERPED